MLRLIVLGTNVPSIHDFQSNASKQLEGMRSGLYNGYIKIRKNLTLLEAIIMTYTVIYLSQKSNKMILFSVMH